MRAYREWRVYLLADDLRPVLVSTYMDTVWLEAELQADQEPEPALHGFGNLHGVHAATADYPRGHDSTYLHMVGNGRPTSTPRALGAVELSGTIVEHADGVLRASAARVLALRLLMLADPCPERCDRWIGLPQGDYVSRHGPPPHRRLLYLAAACSSSGHLPDQVFLDDPQPNSAPSLLVHRWQEACAAAPGAARRPPYTGAELERLLLERYEVPRLPDGEGPWAR